MLIKFLLLAVAIFVLYKLVTNEKGRKEKTETKSRDKKIATGELVKDPICGSYVDATGSISVRDGNKIHKFCSYECREKFLQQLEESGRAIPGRDEDDE